jgi:hypothetical protein
MSRKARILVVGALLASCAPLMMGQGCAPGTSGGGTTPGATSLTGTWSGNITLSTRYATSLTGPTTVAAPGTTTVSDTTTLSMTFSATGVPALLPVVCLYDSAAGHVTTQNIALVQPGQVNTFNIGSLFYTVTVQQTTYTATYMRVVLNVEVAGGTTLPGPGGYTEATTAGPDTQVLEASLATGGLSVNWAQNFTIESLTHRTYAGFTVNTWTAQETTGTASLTQ